MGDQHRVHKSRPFLGLDNLGLDKSRGSCSGGRFASGTLEQWMKEQQQTCLHVGPVSVGQEPFPCCRRPSSERTSPQAMCSCVRCLLPAMSYPSVCHHPCHHPPCHPCHPPCHPSLSNLHPHCPPPATLKKSTSRAGRTIKKLSLGQNGYGSFSHWYRLLSLCAVYSICATCCKLALA